MKDQDQIAIRSLFVPRKDYYFVMIDYDQMEYRLLLEYCSEFGLIEKVKNGLDVHQATADMLGVDRYLAKTINFMTIYGGGVAKLCGMIGKPTLMIDDLKDLEKARRENWGMGAIKTELGLDQKTIDYNIAELEVAAKLKQKYMGEFKRLDAFCKTVAARAKYKGYIRSLFGRILRIPSPNQAYKAVNYLIQGSCADIVKEAMLKVDYHLKVNEYQSRMLLQIHDELLFEVHKSEEWVVGYLKRCMQSAYEHKYLPLTTSVEYSNTNWADKTEFQLFGNNFID